MMRAPGHDHLPDRLPFVLVLLLTLFAAANRIHAIDGPSLWTDELWGMWVSSLGSWGKMLGSMVWGDSHPPGYQSMLYLWVETFGRSDTAVRMPSVLAGIAAVPALHLFVARYFTPRMGVLAAAVLTTSYNAIYFSQEARAYVFLLLFSILYFHAAFRIVVDGDHRWRARLALAAISALLAYFHYMGMVFMGAGLLFMLLWPAFRGHRRVLWQVCLLTALFYAPWIPPMVMHLFSPHESWETTPPDTLILMKTVKFVWGPDLYRLLVGLASVLAWLFACALHGWRRQPLPAPLRWLGWLLLFSLMPWLLFILKSYVSTPAYTVRHFIYVIPAACIVLAWAVDLLLRRLGAGPVSLVGGVTVWLVATSWLNVSDLTEMNRKLYHEATKHEYRQAVKVIASDAAFMQQRQRAVFTPNVFFTHYLQYYGVLPAQPRTVKEFEPERFPDYQQQVTEDRLETFYFVEILRDREIRRYSPALQAFRRHYHALCATELPLTRVMKFNTTAAPNPGKALPRCALALQPPAMVPFSAARGGNDPAASPAAPTQAVMP